MNIKINTLNLLLLIFIKSNSNPLVLTEPSYSWQNDFSLILLFQINDITFCTKEEMALFAILRSGFLKQQ